MTKCKSTFSISAGIVWPSWAWTKTGNWYDIFQVMMHYVSPNSHIETRTITRFSNLFIVESSWFVLSWQQNGTLAIEWCDADVMQAIKLKLWHKSGKPDLLRSNVRYSTSVGRTKVVNLLARQIEYSYSVPFNCYANFFEVTPETTLCSNNVAVEHSYLLNVNKLFNLSNVVT